MLAGFRGFSGGEITGLKCRYRIGSEIYQGDKDYSAIL